MKGNLINIFEFLNMFIRYEFYIELLFVKGLSVLILVFYICLSVKCI